MNTTAELLARTGEGAKAGPIGLVVILLLCVACYFLFKSMSKHMRKVREDFPADDKPAPSQAEDDRADSAVASGEGTDTRGEGST